MKVTKLIREYVEEQVSNVYNAKVNPYSEQAKIDRQKFKDFTKELANQQKEAIEKFLSENEVFEDDWRGFRRKTYASTNVPCFDYCKTQAIIDEENWKKENTRQKNAKIREIMLSLELGANRQELNEMIAKLLEE